MLLYAVRRALMLIPTLLGLLLLTFILMRLVPGDPAAAIAGDAATPERIAEIRQELGLDAPLFLQFFDYAMNALRGDFGVSFYSNRPVGLDIVQRLPATLELTFAALLIAAVGGILLGALAGMWRNSPFDYIVRVTTVLGLAVASFWFAIMLQLVFSMQLNLLPLRGRFPAGLATPAWVTGSYIIDSILAGRLDALRGTLLHLTLPAVTVALTGLATVGRFTRSAVVSNMESDYVAYERAVGYPQRRILFPYVLKNSLVTPVTQIGLLYGAFISQAVAVEAVFDWPGLGSYLVNSIFNADFNAIIAVTLVIGLVYGVVNIIVDIVHGLIDPRVAERM